MFHVGQKVVCVDAKGPWIPGGELRKNAVYTVIKVDSPYLDIAEVPNLTDGPGFYQRRFRPVIERKTDTGMATLREILDRETITDKPRAPVRAR